MWLDECLRFRDIENNVHNNYVLFIFISTDKMIAKDLITKSKECGPGFFFFK